MGFLLKFSFRSSYESVNADETLCKDIRDRSINHNFDVRAQFASWNQCRAQGLHRIQTITLLSFISDSRILHFQLKIMAVKRCYGLWGLFRRFEIRSTTISISIHFPIKWNVFIAIVFNRFGMGKQYKAIISHLSSGRRPPSLDQYFSLHRK